MDDEWDEGIALEGHTAGLAALQREGLPDAEAFGRFLAEHEAELFAPGAEDEIDITADMTRSFQEQGVDLTDDDIGLFLQATHEIWSSYWALGASTHALLEAPRARGLTPAVVPN